MFDPMYSIYQDIQAGANTYLNIVVEHSKSLSNTITHSLNGAIESVTPYTEGLTQKVQTTWQQTWQQNEPYFQASVDVARSPLGISAILLVGAITCMVVAREVENR